MSLPCGFVYVWNIHFFHEAISLFDSFCCVIANLLFIIIVVFQFGM